MTTTLDRIVIDKAKKAESPYKSIKNPKKLLKVHSSSSINSNSTIKVQKSC